MATPLLDDVISNIPLEFDNAAGVAVAAPAGGTVAVTLSNTAMGTVAMGADGKSVDFTPAQPPDDTQTGAISLSDTSGSLTITATLDISLTKDEQAARAHFVTTGITTRPITPAP